MGIIKFMTWLCAVLAVLSGMSVRTGYVTIPALTVVLAATVTVIVVLTVIISRAMRNVVQYSMVTMISESAV